MPFEGPVRMKAPNHHFHCILHYTKGTHILLHLFLGTLVAEGQRFINDAFDLKKRHYIGPTSTCAELAFLMSNQIQTKKGSFIWDCFVGTGSLHCPCGGLNSSIFKFQYFIRFIVCKSQTLYNY